MSEFADVLMVTFYNKKNEVICPKPQFLKDNKIDESGRMYIDLNSQKHKMILEILLKADSVTLNGQEWRIVETNYHIDGTALFIILD